MENGEGIITLNGSAGTTTAVSYDADAIVSDADTAQLSMSTPGKIGLFVSTTANLPANCDSLSYTTTGSDVEYLGCLPVVENNINVNTTWNATNNIPDLPSWTFGAGDKIFACPMTFAEAVPAAHAATAPVVVSTLST